MTAAGLLIGLLFAAFLFAATLWSAAQMFYQSGGLRIGHGVSFVATVGGIAAFQALIPVLALLCGVALIVGGGLTFAKARGWPTGLSAVQMIFGLFLILALPFMG